MLALVGMYYVHAFRRIRDGLLRLRDWSDGRAARQRAAIAATPAPIWLRMARATLISLLIGLGFYALLRKSGFSVLG